MARLARIVIPGLPHLITQRGNRRETVFFGDEDYQSYLNMLRDEVNKARSEIWAWCLLPNHVHLIVAPSHIDGLRQSVANAHRRYTSMINARNKWTGHLWQGRYGSVVMDEPHLMAAFSYVSQNPVRAGLVKHATDWKWSSVHAHLAREDDGLTTVEPALSRIPDFERFLDEQVADEQYEPLRRAEIVGRPVGDADFMAKLEKQTKRTLTPQKRGRKPGKTTKGKKQSQKPRKPRQKK